MNSRRYFGRALWGASVIGLAAYLASAFLPDEHHGALLLVSLMVLWSITAALAFQKPPLVQVILLSAALPWGFLLSLTIAICIQNWDMSVAWGPFLGALVFAPLGIFISVMPLWTLGKRLVSLLSLSVVSVILIGLILCAKIGMLPFVYKGPKAPPGRYDAAAWSVEFSPNPAKVGESLRITYSVKNVGESTIPPRTYEVEFYVNNQKEGFDYAASEILPGAMSTYSYTVAGSFDLRNEKLLNYRLIVDPRGRLEETDETNNTLEGSITVVP